MTVGPKSQCHSYFQVSKIYYILCCSLFDQPIDPQTLKMKKLLFCLALPASLFICSCSKDSPKPATPSMVGLWIGTYSAANEDVQGLYESFDLKADSTLEVQSQGADGNTYYGAGTWSTSGMNFTTTYAETNFGNQGVAATFTGTWTTATMQISGTWLSADHSASGAFSMTKVP